MTGKRGKEKGMARLAGLPKFALSSDGGGSKLPNLKHLWGREIEREK